MYNYYQQTLKFVHLSQEAVSNSTEGSIYITQAVKKSKGSPDPHVPVFERSTSMILSLRRLQGSTLTKSAKFNRKMVINSIKFQ